MEEAFDPYRKWLGIPPEEQPPNHYRLLGIALFEDDPDVISNAADRQMAHVRTYQTGKRAPLSQALLNELSGAKVCLLDPASKRAYDKELSARHARLPRAVAAPASGIPTAKAPPGAVPAAAPLPVATPVTPVATAVQEVAAVRPANARPQPQAAEPAPAAISVSRRTSRVRTTRRSSPSAAISAVAAIGLLVVVVLLVVFFLANQGGDDATDAGRGGQRPTKKSRSDSGPAPTSPSPAAEGPTVPIASKSGNEPTTPTVKSTVKPDAPSNATDDSATPPQDKNDPPDGAAKPPKPADAPTDATPPADDTEDDATSRATVKKPPSPSADAIDKAYRIVRKEFEPQLREALEPEERFELAQQMIERAATTDEPATRYALHLLARNLSVQMASAEQACEVIDLLARHFAIDAFEMKRQSLDDVSQFVTLELDDYAHLLRLMQRTAREALAAENSDAAVGLTRLAKAVSLKVRNPKAHKELPRLEDLLADVDRLAAEAAEYDREVKGFDRSMRQLEKDAADTGANLSVGRYWLLVKGDWKKALPHLAQGADPAWKDPATIDLAVPQTVAEQVALADAWQALAVRKGGLAAPRLFERARMWYARAAEAAEETQKAAIAAKIAEVEKRLRELQPPANPPTSGEPSAADGENSPNAGPAADANPDAAPPEKTSPDATDDDGPAFPDG